QSFKKQYEYDGLGRLSSVCEISATLPGVGTCGQATTQTGYWTKYTYDALGHLTKVTQNAQAASGQQQTRLYSYDMLGRLLQEANPESGTTTYSYDIVPSYCVNPGTAYPGSLTGKQDPNGDSVCYEYDALGRLTDVGSRTGCKRF